MHYRSVGVATHVKALEEYKLIMHGSVCVQFLANE